MHSQNAWLINYLLTRTMDYDPQSTWNGIMDQFINIAYNTTYTPV